MALLIFVLAVLMRLVVIVVATQLTGYTISRLDSEAIGANIGAGLVAFAVAMVIAFLWAWRDARALGRSPALLLWSVTAVAFGVASAFAIQMLSQALSGTGIDRSVLVSDLLTTAPFLVVLVFVPALIGLALGRPRSHPN